MRFNQDKSALFRKLRHRFLAADAWIDSQLYAAQARAGDWWRDFSGFMERFHVRGASRTAVELGCEALTLGVFGGLVMVVLAQPAFKMTANPDWLRNTNLSVVFRDRDGMEVGRRGALHDDSLAVEQYSDYLIQALLATEDRRFFDHWGIDPIGLARALTVNARASGAVQGGSTLTQQLAKNLFLSNERTVSRKINEAFLAFWLESRLTKREILQHYLDRAYMGGGVFGAQAAAQFYFGHSIKDVTLAEAAMLAGLFKAPTKYAPHKNLPAARGRANDVLSSLVASGFMAENQVAEARRNPATAIARSDKEATPDWYLDWAFAEVKALADAGKLGPDRVLNVKLALDSRVQKKAEETVEKVLRESGKTYNARQAAVVIMETDGAVHALVGGRDYGASQFNRAVDAHRQPGSSFKPYVYLTALMTGKFTPQSIVIDAPICLGTWCPKNYGGSYNGAIPLASALANSLNTVAVRLSLAAGDGDGRKGRQRITETAHRLGITSPLPDVQSLPLGAGEVTVMDQATGYAAFANGGKRIKPHAALEVLNSRGELIYRFDRDGEQPQQVVAPRYIEMLDSMLIKVVEGGTGTRAALNGIRVGGKTGTTSDYKDAWFCGFTGNFVGAVWFGNDDDEPMIRATGGTMPAMTWHDIMQFAHSGVDLKPLPGATLIEAQGPWMGGGDVSAAPRRPDVLSRKAADTLGGIEVLMKSASARRALLDLRAPDVAAAGTDRGGGRGVIVELR